MPQSRHDHLHDRQADLRSGLVEHDQLHAARLDEGLAAPDVLGEVIRPLRFERRRPAGGRGGVGQEVRLVRDSGRLEPVEGVRILDRGPRRGRNAALGQVGEHLVHLGDGPQEGHAGIEMRPEARHDAFLRAIQLPGDRGEDGDAQVRGEVEYPHLASASCQVRLQPFEVRIGEASKVDRGASDAVVPPEGDGVALDQLEEPLQDRFLGRVPGRAAVGVADADRLALGLRRVVVAEGRGQVTRLATGQRPGGRPLDCDVRVKRHRDEVEVRRPRVPRAALAILPLAEEQAIGERDRGVAEPPGGGAPAGLVAPEDARVPLQALAEAAGPGLRVGGPLARAHVPQVAAEVGQAAVPPGQVTPGEVDVHRGVRPGHHCLVRSVRASSRRR